MRLVNRPALRQQLWIVRTQLDAGLRAHAVAGHQRECGSGSGNRAGPHGTDSEIGNKDRSHAAHGRTALQKLPYTSGAS